METTMRDATVVTLHDLVHLVNRRHEEHPALCETDGACVTYGEMRRYALAIDRYLCEQGVGFGDRVALIAENRPEWGLWYLGVTAAGAVILPVLTDFSPNDVQSILSHAAPKLIVTSEKAAALTEGWTATPVVDCGIVRELTAPASDAAADGPALDGATPGGSAPDTAGARDIEPETLAALIYTSGTTGNPKGVMLSHRNLITNAQAVQEIFDVDEDDVLLSVLPLAHTYECTIGFLVPLLSGASVTYLDGPPTPSRLLPALESIRPTIMLVVPLIIEKVYRSRVAPKLAKMPRALRRFPPVRRLLHYLAGAKLKRSFGGRLEVFGIGGAPLAPDTERFLRDARFPYTIGYGLTETAPLLTGTAPFETRFRSTGLAVSGVELRIADGEIQARGPNVMLGYFRNPDATAETFTDDGWFRTGDLGSMDADGYIYVQGRLKTLIVGPSGENIYPEEIEATIEAEPLVEDSLVLSDGGKLIARVRLDLDALAEQLGTIASELDPGTIAETGTKLLEDLRRSVNARLNHFSRLARMVLQIEDFERTPTRKIKRFRYQSDETSAESR
ncbi:MAG: AMP-binding protein [Spirochaetes bacterium]|jgi:long-chain acyl-CoA synthetase|nr:AMP-binding protein [Spirochaetota bacterium]